MNETPPSKRVNPFGVTTFLNVDLDISSRLSLEPLGAAFGRSVFAALLLLITGGCTSVDERLPDVAPSAGVATIACNDAMPPAVLPTRVGSELHSCLSATQLRGEATVVVGVARDGTATSVEPAFTLCLVLDADGTPLPKLELTATQEQCLLERLRSWRFAAYETCAPQMAYVDAAQRGGNECD